MSRLSFELENETFAVDEQRGGECDALCDVPLGGVQGYEREGRN